MLLTAVFVYLTVERQKSPTKPQLAALWGIIKEPHTLVRLLFLNSCYIEADELLDLGEDEDVEESGRCQLATSIANIKFSQLETKNVA